jgi:hypothetical protein
MAAGYSREAVFSGGRIEQKREIDHRRRASAMVQSEGFHFSIRRAIRRAIRRPIRRERRHK